MLQLLKLLVKLQIGILALMAELSRGYLTPLVDGGFVYGED
jgi:hypothetical protein